MEYALSQWQVLANVLARPFDTFVLIMEQIPGK